MACVGSYSSLNITVVIDCCFHCIGLIIVDHAASTVLIPHTDLFIMQLVVRITQRCSPPPRKIRKFVSVDRFACKQDYWKRYAWLSTKSWRQWDLEQENWPGLET